MTQQGLIFMIAYLSIIGLDKFFLNLLIGVWVFTEL